MSEPRRTGTELVPTIEWGTHFCQFYQTPEDLLDQVVPYLKAGLESGEACVWVTSPPLEPAAARAALAAVVPDLDALESRSQLRITPHTECYLQDGIFDGERVLAGWLAELRDALGRGFEGLRVTGNIAWLEQAGWRDFQAYEEAISGAIASQPVLALCTYALDRCGAHEILDVVKNHDFALIKRADRWEVIESHHRRALRDALSVSRMRYETFFQGALAAISLNEIVTDGDGAPIDYVFLDVNPAFEEMTGLKASEVIGRPATQVWPDLAQTSFIRTYGQVALTREPRRFVEHVAASDRYFQINAFSPAPRQFAAIVRDITGEKRAARERERLYAEAREANRLKDEFLATLSHELRTPLNAILGWSQLLMAGSLDAETRQRALASIVRNAEAQNGLIADVLDVSRIITGKLRLTMAEVDVQHVLDDAIAAVTPAADAKRIRIDRVVRADCTRLVADADRLRQVLWNLLSNAVKFTPTDGLVRVEIDRTASKLEVRVTDTGAGIAADFLPRVFERFTQADGSASRLHGGLGLGLAIVRHLVELHGGDVAAESAGEGQGATFAFRLPVYAVSLGENAARQGGAGMPDGASAYDLSGVRVLVVDDEADARDVVCLVLSNAGARVICAESAPDALQILEAGTHVDVIVSDIGMPGMDGYDLIRSLRALSAVTGMVPAIALTAYGREDDRARALACGYQDHHAKPVAPAQLVAAVWRAYASPQSGR